MEANSLVPKLRFSEFGNNWTYKRLDEVCSSFTYGVGASAKKFDGKNKYLRITDIDDSTNKFIPKPLTSPDCEINDKDYLEEGDIVFARTGASVGKSYLYDKKDGQLVFAGFLIRAKITKANSEFIFQKTKTDKYNRWVHIFSMRSGQPGINAQEYKSYKLCLPPLAEQKKIASFLSSVDKKINLLTKKKALLETYKKGVMQKIFSQEIRFKDEEGKDFPDWEFKRGNELFDSISNKSHNSDLPILAISQEFGAIPRELINYKVSVTNSSVSSYKVVEKGDFIISLRSFQGGIEYSIYKGICSPAYIILRPTKEINDYYFKLYFKTHSYIQELTKKLEGIRDGKMISYKYFSEINLPYPCIREQNKIASFLSSIDKKIEQVNFQLDRNKEFKKGLLQQMFV